MATPIPPEVKSVVTFIFVEGKDQKLVPNGTGFFVGVKNPTNPDQYSVYLVTAKHVLYKPNSTEFMDKVYIRLNKRKGGSEIGIVPIKAEGTNRNLFTHEDTSVDMAVIPLLPDQEKFDFKFLPDEMVTAKADYENLKIGEGSDVFF